MTPEVAIEKTITAVIQREGGYVNHPADRGGPTKYGITQKALEKWRGQRVTAQNVKDMRLEEAKRIIRLNYIEVPKFHRIDNATLFGLLVDFGYHSGAAAAITQLQKAFNEEFAHMPSLTVDGVLGPKTSSVVNALLGANIRRLHNRLVDNRIRFVCGIVGRDRTQAVFLNGWIERILEFRINQ